MDATSGAETLGVTTDPGEHPPTTGAGSPDVSEPAPPAPKERRRRPHRRRREMLDAAALVFYQKGYDASSTQDIADLVGILKGSLYYYIESKEDFLFEIIQEIHEGALGLVDPIGQVDGDCLMKLGTLIFRQVQYYSENHVFATIYFREYRSLSAARRAPIEKSGRQYRKFVQALLKEGQREGTVSADLDVATAGIAMIEMLNSIHRWFQPGGRVTSANIGRDLATMLVLGVASNEAVQLHGGLEEFRAQLRNALV
jgi:AcrR family transcriptional regulator